MDKKELFIYSPEKLTFSEYWEIALSEANHGRFIPFCYYDRAADFASKIHSILQAPEEWEKSYRLRIKRIAYAYHLRKYFEIKYVRN